MVNYHKLINTFGSNNGSSLKISEYRQLISILFKISTNSTILTMNLPIQ